nr:diguanylate cyclase [Corallococcus exiguus]
MGSYNSTGEIAARFDQESRHQKARLVHDILNGQNVELERGHLGRLRLAELQDELRSSRLREPFGILYDGRDAERDLAVAIMNGRPEAPVSVAYLDMNGLKAFNEDGDHATGDAAIKAFFHVLSKAISDAGDVYRKGGDEVVVVMPATSLDVAKKRMLGALASLGNETIQVAGKARSLSSSCGLLTISSSKEKPEDVIHRADLAQKKAKTASKLEHGVRRSTLAVVEGDAVKVESI